MKRNIPAPAQLLHRGINLSMPYECGIEAEIPDEKYDLHWGWNEETYRIVKAKGFDHIRLPVGFEFFFGKKEDEAWLFDHLDRSVEYALNNGLSIVLDCHNFEGVIQDYANSKNDFLCAWEEVVKRYRNLPDTLMYEILNEPTTAMSVDNLDDMQGSVIELIRHYNKERIVVAGCRCCNLPERLSEITLPEDDDNIIIDIHNYAPKSFTHQPLFEYKTKVSFDSMMKGDTLEQFDFASEYAAKTGRLLWLGEFGCYQTDISDEDSEKYARFMIEECEKRGFPYCWWDFCYGFGAYSLKRKSFKPFSHVLVGQ